MNFFRDKKKIKAGIEEYVISLKVAYDSESLFPLQEICSDAGIELLQSRIGTTGAFKLASGQRGVIHDPNLPRYALLYNLTKKVGHHLLGHFEREPPIYIVEAEAHYFAEAAVRSSFITLRCAHVPPWYSLFVTEEKIKMILANYYSSQDKPVLL